MTKNRRISNLHIWNFCQIFEVSASLCSYYDNEMNGIEIENEHSERAAETSKQCRARIGVTNSNVI